MPPGQHTRTEKDWFCRGAPTVTGPDHRGTTAGQTVRNHVVSPTPSISAGDLMKCGAVGAASLTRPSASCNVSQRLLQSIQGRRTRSRAVSQREMFRGRPITRLAIGSSEWA
jgi:hypothetical protein